LHAKKQKSDTSSLFLKETVTTLKKSALIEHQVAKSVLKNATKTAGGGLISTMLMGKHAAVKK
jgi:hypothetical protein